MKRTPLKRKTPLQAKTHLARRAIKPRKRQAIKTRGKQAAYYAEQAADRDQWKHEQRPVCQVCGAKDSEVWRGLAVHEIERRSQAKHSHTRANYLLVCTPCHEGAIPGMPHAVQLAYKLLADPANYDLEQWLRLRDPALRAPSRVTQHEVDQRAQEIRSRRP